MRKLTPEEAQEIEFLRHKGRPLNKVEQAALNLAIGEALEVSHDDWTIRTDIRIAIPGRGRKVGRKFSVRKRPDGNGHYIIRVQ